MGVLMHSIKRKIIFAVVLIVSMAFIVFAIYDYNVFRSAALLEIEEHSSIKVDRLAENLALPVWEIDEHWVGKVIESEMQDKRTYAVLVYSEGVLFAGKERDKSWQVVSSVNHITGDFITRSKSILHDGEEIGLVKLYVSKTFMADQLNERLLREMVTLVLLGLFISVILLLLLNRIVVRRLQHMLDATKAIAAGDYASQLQVSQHDEISMLGDGINTMKRNIQQRENRIRLLLDSTAEGIYGLDLEGRCTFANKQCLALLGYQEVDELLGKNMHALIHHTQNNGSPYQEEECYIYESFKKGEGAHIVGELFWHKDGTGFPSEYSSFPVWQDNNIIGSVVTFTDITERQQAEEKIRRYSQAMEQSGEAIVITDVNGVIEHINPAFTLITGYTEDESVGRKTSLLRSGSQNAGFYEAMWDTITHGQTWQGKIINRKKSGECYPAMLTISPIKNDDGIVTRYIGIQQNLEKFEELEAQFHQSQKMEAVGTLVGGIAHDFNNTLAGITGNLYLAKKAAKGLPDVVKRLDSVEKLSFSAAATIQQLLTFSRKGIVQMHPIAISSFLKETIKLQQVSLPENIKFELLVNDTEMQVKGDINQLQQVLMNLMNNAFDAVEGSEGPEIHVQLDHFYADADFIKLHDSITEGEYACIAVIDNGSGIQAKNLEHIFEPFFTTKEPGRGTGLGLAMVYGAVRTHAGLIDVTSSQIEPTGTTIQIYLPLLRSGEAVALDEQHDEIIRGQGETILLVDDNETVLETGRDVLEGLGYIVLTAEDGVFAIEQYQAHKDEIDMLILDVVMPRLGGVEALQAIRDINPDVKAMFATGYDKLSTLGARQNEITEKVISKPFAVSKLSQAIREVLD